MSLRKLVGSFSEVKLTAYTVLDLFRFIHIRRSTVEACGGGGRAAQVKRAMMERKYGECIEGGWGGLYLYVGVVVHGKAKRCAVTQRARLAYYGVSTPSREVRVGKGPRLVMEIEIKMGNGNGKKG